MEEIATPEGPGCFACALGGEDGRTLLVCAAPDFLETNRRAAREAVLLSIYQPGPDPPAAGVLEQIMQEVRAVEDDMQAAGAWVFSGGLHAPDTATVVDPRAGLAMTDGPYVEGKEHIGGVVIIQAESLDEALAWGRRVAGATTLPIEVRPFQGELED